MYSGMAGLDKAHVVSGDVYEQFDRKRRPRIDQISRLAFIGNPGSMRVILAKEKELCPTWRFDMGARFAM